MSTALTRRAFVVVLLMAAVLATACTSSDGTDSAAAEGEGPVGTTAESGDSGSEPVSTTVADGTTTSRLPPTASIPAPVDLTSVAPMLLIQFGQAWADANWKAMAAVADGTVVTEATDRFVADADPPITGDNVVGIVEACQAQSEENVWACPVDYGSGDSATTFDLMLEQTSSGLRITGLSPNGG